MTKRYWLTKRLQVKMKIINEQLINSVVEQAKNSPRLRMNYNL